jgi:hypothetical protein
MSSSVHYWQKFVFYCRLRLKCDDTSAETRFRLSAKRTSPLKSAEASVQSTTGSRGVRISGSNAGYTMFRGSAKSTGYPLHSPVSSSLSHPCVTVCHQISTGLYQSRCNNCFPLAVYFQVLWPSRFWCGAGNRWQLFGEEFPCFNCTKCWL